MSDRLSQPVRRGSEPSADIVVGLGFGDEGKGATTDALAVRHKADRVVRFNGGQQAGHNVIVNGRHHTAATFGAGVLANVPTYITKYCTYDPIAMYREWHSLTFDHGLRPVLYVDENALVTTPFHRQANLIMESINGHGTTGMGFGETIRYSLDHDPIRVKDLNDFDVLVDKLTILRRHYINTLGYIGDYSPENIAAFMPQFGPDVHIISTDHLLDAVSTGHSIFEGAQGFLLDENYGFHPHTTWSTTTPKNAREVLNEAGVENVTTYGCLRSYATRHGAGPLYHEGELDKDIPEPHNSSDGIQGAFRTAPHAMSMVDWAIKTAEVDLLSIGHLDVFDGLMTDEGLIDLDSLSRPVAIKGYGPNREDRCFAPNNKEGYKE